MKAPKFGGLQVPCSNTNIYLQAPNIWERNGVGSMEYELPNVSQLMSKESNSVLTYDLNENLQASIKQFYIVQSLQNI